MDMGADDDTWKDEATGAIVDYGYFEENVFWAVYKRVKPYGTHESWSEDIGFPPSTIRITWEIVTDRVGKAKARPVVHFLWTTCWWRKHNSFRSMAAEWNTSKTKFEKAVKRVSVMVTIAFGWVRT